MYSLIPYPNFPVVIMDIAVYTLKLFCLGDFKWKVWSFLTGGT